MQPISFAGTAFSSLGVSARFVRDLPGEARNPQWLARSGSPPVLAGVSHPGRTVPVVFRQDNADDSAEDCMVRLLGALDPSDDTPRPLVCTLMLDDDGDGVPDDAHTVSVDCVVGAYTWAVDELGINVVFHAAEDVWRETTDATAGPTSVSGNDLAAANPTFATDLTGWAENTVTAGVTYAASRDAAVFSDAAGSLLLDITANAAGVGAQVIYRNSTFLPVTVGGTYLVVASNRTSNANITPRLRISWYDVAEALLSSDIETDWTPTINTWTRRTHSAVAPASAAFARAMVVAHCDTAGATGDCWFDDVWFSEETTDNVTTTATNDGEAPAFPQIRLTWDHQREFESNTVGWRYRVVVPVANAGPRHWSDELIPLALGDTTALVTAGKALASGDDVRVFLDGRELPRQLVNWNTLRGFLVFPLTLEAGETAEVEVAYGNPDANDPRNARMTLDAFSGTEIGGYAAPDLGGDSGTTSAASTSTVLTDSSQAWVVDRWAGGTLMYLTVPNGSFDGQVRKVLSNTATTITVDRVFNGTVPNAGATYVVWMSGVRGNGGLASSSTGTTLTDSSQAFGVNEYAGGVVEIHTGTGAAVGTFYAIESNTATQLTITGATWALDGTSRYRLWRWGFLSWYVDHVAHAERWRGRHRLNRGTTPPSRVWFRSDGVPGAWDRVLTLRNADDYRQLKWTTVDVGGGNNDYFAGLDVRRKRGSEDTFNEEGFADGLAFGSAMLLRGFRFDYDYTNEDGVGKIVALAKTPGGESWSIVDQETTTQATLTARAAVYVDLTDAEGLPQYVAQAVWPADEVEIPGTADRNSEANVRDDEVCEVYLDTAAITVDGLGPSAYVVDWSGDEEEVYDLTCNVVDAASAAAATRWVSVGGQDHRLLLPSGDVLVVDCAAGEVFTYTGSLTATSYARRHRAYAAVVYDQVADPDEDGATTLVVSSAWFPLPPGSTTVAVREYAMGTLRLYLVFAEGYVV